MGLKKTKTAMQPWLHFSDAPDGSSTPATTDFHTLGKPHAQVMRALGVLAARVVPESQDA